ncbi:hypothetical protein [Methylotenera versatilis]|uniref:Uncharacterized protein n=1 Tax=Methylotenera versatilis (strain 301) TaxID=666681 RepID=D7DLA8_METV0|nr:hypothetical protein [Methylotenera versatilis]ADI30579.1 hypothetical protein M301_2213 [Methylotenera versatilis 301]
MVIAFNRFAALLSLMLFLGASSNVFAGEYEGSWMLYDTHGGGFEATLSEDGTASGTHGDSMKHGTWKEVDGAVVISWKTGWTTRIVKQGDKYVKTSFKPGTTITDTPTDTSEAKKKH